MKSIFVEVGTELVAASALSEKSGIAAVLPRFWGKFPEKASTDLLALSLTNQLNIAEGGENLEKSILYGKDYFKNAIIEKYGEKNYVFLAEQINDISVEEQEYLAQYLNDEEEKLEPLRIKLLDKAIKIQDYILRLEFDKKMQEIDSEENAHEFLKELVAFSSNRLKIEAISVDENGKEKSSFEDEGFTKYFENSKTYIKSKFPNINVDYIEENLIDLPVNDLSFSVSEEELIEIEQMAMAFENLSRKKLKERNKEKRKSFFRKLFGKEKKAQLLAGNELQDKFIVEQKNVNYIPNTSKVIHHENIELEK